MTRAVDSNVLMDILAPNLPHYEASLATLTHYSESAQLVVCDLVVAEVGMNFNGREDLWHFLEDTKVMIVKMSDSASYIASQAWRAYVTRRPDGFACAACGATNRPSCTRCGTALRSRQRVIADFIIGAHALVDTEGLITRDTRYFKTYFPALTLL